MIKRRLLRTRWDFSISRFAHPLTHSLGLTKIVTLLTTHESNWVYSARFCNDCGGVFLLVFARYTFNVHFSVRPSRFMCRSVNHQDEKSNNFLRVYPSLIFNVYIWQGSSYPCSETTCMLNNVAKLQSIKISSSLGHPAEQSSLVKSADFLQLFLVTVCRRQILMHHFFPLPRELTHPTCHKLWQI